MRPFYEFYRVVNTNLCKDDKTLWFFNSASDQIEIGKYIIF